MKPFTKALFSVLFLVGTIYSQTVTTLTGPIDGGTGGVSVDAEGNIYVADFGTNLGSGNTPGDKVFKVTPAGEVTVFATGLVGASGNHFDSNGDLFQSNIAAGRISRITPDGTVSTFVSSGIFGPVGIAIDENDDLFVCNCGNNTIQKVTSQGVSTQFASSSLLSCPNGITLADDGNFYVANFNNGSILKITPNGSVSFFANVPGNNNGHLVFFDGDLYVAGRGANRIYKVTLAGEVSVFAGNGVRAVVDGPALQASFSLPNDLAFDPTGRFLYVNDVLNPPNQAILEPMVVRRIDLGQPTGIADDDGNQPAAFTLFQNFPNPFNPSTSISYELPQSERVILQIYNVLGEKVRTLVDERQAAGVQSVVWDGTDDAGQIVSTGTYVYELTVGDVSEKKKMMFVK